MVIKWLKYSYHAALIIAVAYNTWCILKLNAVVNAIVAFLMQNMR